MFHADLDQIRLQHINFTEHKMQFIQLDLVTMILKLLGEKKLQTIPVIVCNIYI